MMIQFIPGFLLSFQLLGLGIVGLGSWLLFVQVHYEDLHDLLFLPSVLMVALGALVLVVAIMKLVGACRCSTATLWVVSILSCLRKLQNNLRVLISTVRTAILNDYHTHKPQVTTCMIHTFT